MKKTYLSCLLSLCSCAASADIRDCLDYLYPAEVAKCETAAIDKLDYEIFGYVQEISERPIVYGTKTSMTVLEDYDAEKTAVYLKCKSSNVCKYEHLKKISDRFQSMIARSKNRLVKPAKPAAEPVSSK